MDIKQGTQDVGGSGNYRSSPGDACVTPQPIAAVRRLSVQLPFPVMTETRCSNKFAWHWLQTRRRNQLSALLTCEPGPKYDTVLHSAIQTAAPAAEEDAEEDFRPPSPKYDERSFFFSAAHPWAARTPAKSLAPRGRTHLGGRTQQQPMRTPGTSLLRPDTPRMPHSGASGSVGGGRSAAETPATRPADMPAGVAAAGGAKLACASEDGSAGRSTSQPQPQRQQEPPLNVPATAAGHRPPAGAGPSPLKKRRLESQLSPVDGGGGSADRVPETPLSQAGFKRMVPGKGQCLTLLSVEIVADCRCDSCVFRHELAM